jgi:hypothetical protein
VQKGIKESQEMLAAILEVAVVLGPILRDGFQAGQDLSAIFAQLSGNEALKAKIAAAVEKANEVPAELKDLDLNEGLQLLIVAVPEIQRVLDAWKEVEAPAPAVKA